MKVTKHLENHIKVHTNLSKKEVIVNNLLGGLAWGLGTVIGATVVVAILVGILRFIGLEPIMSEITKGIDNNKIVNTK